MRDAADVVHEVNVREDLARWHLEALVEELREEARRELPELLEPALGEAGARAMTETFAEAVPDLVRLAGIEAQARQRRAELLDGFLEEAKLAELSWIRRLPLRGLLHRIRQRLDAAARS